MPHYFLVGVAWGLFEFGIFLVQISCKNICDGGLTQNTDRAYMLSGKKGIPKMLILN